MLKVTEGRSSENYRLTELRDIREDSPFEKQHDPDTIYIILENRAVNLDFKMNPEEVLVLAIYSNGKTFVLRKSRATLWLIRYMDVELRIVGPEQTPRV